MITLDYVRTMAGYNRWQNENLYGAAEKLTDQQRKEQRGAFFGSIHGTLNHLLWGDQMWMSRFAGTPPPKGKRPADSTSERETWAELRESRAAFDATIIDWAGRIDQRWLQEDLTWFSGAAGREVTKPRALLVAHFFNHQTHHRGQVHCMLTQCGVKPGDTDLPFQRQSCHPGGCAAAIRDPGLKSRRRLLPWIPARGPTPSAGMAAGFLGCSGELR